MKRAFTLMELMVAVLLGSLVMLMIAGSLQVTIRSWDSVQTRVGVNYNRRSVLDLLKRQSSSLFFKSDVDELERSATIGRPSTNRNGGNRGSNRKDLGNRKQIQDNLRNNQGQATSVTFDLPEGSHFFRGGLQELNFLSTVSFLSDFPGQVAVRYYVVQGEPGEDQGLWEMETSRTPTLGSGLTTDDEELDFSFEEGEVQDELIGDLYLYMEEKNLFLAATLGEDLPSGDLFSEPPRLDEEGEEEEGESPAFNPVGNFGGGSGEISEVLATNTMKLLGPLRKFTLRYRIPGVTEAEDADEEDRWEEVWDVGRDGSYPSAIEFTLYYEAGEDIPEENLDRVRMVIPVYDTRNLSRGGSRVPF